MSAMTIRDQIFDVLNNSGPKTVRALVSILEDYDPKNKPGRDGIHPVKMEVLRLINAGKLKWDGGYFLKVVE
jgi:hypothetical protein